MESPHNEEQDLTSDMANDSVSTGQVDAYDVNTASRFFALNAIDPPDVWSQVAQPQPVLSGETSDTIAMSAPAPDRPLLDSDLQTVPVVPERHPVIVSRRPLVEALPAGRHLVSIAAVLLFAAVAGGAVWGLTRQADTTVADGDGAEFAAELASGGDGESSNDNGTEGSVKDQLAADGEASVDQSDDAVTERDESDLEELSGDSDDESDATKNDSAEDDSDDKELDEDNESNSNDDSKSDDQATTTTESTTTTAESTSTTAAVTTVTVRDGEDRPKTTTTPSTSVTQPTTVTTVSQGGVVTFRGVLTESFTDCASHLILDENGNAVDKGEGITCDGGSWIRVNGTRIQTSAGNVITGYFDKHKSFLPGAIVVVKAIETDSRFSLDCDDCEYYAISEPEPSITVIEGEITDILSACINPRQGGSGPITDSCNTYTWIVVNGTRILTGGNDENGNAFSKHEQGWKKGIQVKVSATVGQPTLNCDKCQVEILG